jgi:triacylglycerol lipase
MFSLNPIGASGSTPEPAPAATAPFQLRVEETLASSRRLWVRGRLLGHSSPIPDQSWWERWGKGGSAVSPSPARLETRIGHVLLEAEVPLSPDGHFETLFTAELPKARRGWRMARNRLLHGGQAVEGCSIVLAPPGDVKRAVVVILPLSSSWPADGPQQLARWELASRLTPLGQRFQKHPGGPVFYYLGCASPGAIARQAEIALALAALAWPAGNVVLLPPTRRSPAEVLEEGLDRLRWLFAGDLGLLVLNLEPEVNRRLRPHLRPQADRANVLHLINGAEDALALLDFLPEEPMGFAPQALHPVRTGRVTRHPIVFCHGMLARSALRMQLPEELNSFVPLRQFLSERGFRVLFPRVSPTSGVVERAGQLRDQILRWTDDPVNLVAHSMGGLDARYLVTHLGMAERVRSLTTISTPHRGTYLADWFVANYRNRIPLLLALEAFGVNMDGIRDCRPRACREFNARTPDVPGVQYFSYAGSIPQGRANPVLRRAWALLHAAEGANDGMVSVASARWGEFLGTFPADHYAQTPDAAVPGLADHFDPLGFCLRLVEDLARRGF